VFRTIARPAVTALAFAAVLALGALLAAVLMPNPTAQAAPAVEVAEVAPVVAEPAAPFLVALLGDSGTPENAGELLLAADRVCEGLTAGVPVVVMADGIAAEFGVDDEQARHFVNTAGVVHCAA
jgi:hypothetical protein